MSDFDPTTNRIPFGLLSEGEQTALTGWQHGWEYYNMGGWYEEIDNPTWYNSTVHRGKPAPVVTSKWFNVYPHNPSRAENPTRKTADADCGLNRIAVLRIDTCKGVSTAHLEEI